MVDIIINESGDAAEKVGISNRGLFTVIPILFGIVFILVGANVQPLEPAEQVEDDQLPARAESKAKWTFKP